MEVWSWTVSHSSTSVVFPFAAFDVSPWVTMLCSECKNWGNKIQFSRAKTFEMNWTYSGVPTVVTACNFTVSYPDNRLQSVNPLHTPLSFGHSCHMILRWLVLREWIKSNICQLQIFFNIRWLNSFPHQPHFGGFLCDSPLCSQEHKTGLLESTILFHT